MKKKGLIIATIVMVLVLAVSLTTATYAWFTTTGVTTISGFDVSVTANNDVNIGMKEDNSYSASATADSFKTGAVALSGATPGQLFTGTWTGTTGLGPEITHTFNWGAQSKAVGFSNAALQASDISSKTTATGNLTAIGNSSAYIYGANYNDAKTALANVEAGIANGDTGSDPVVKADYVYMFLGVQPTKALTTCELIILVDGTNSTGTTCGILSAIHVAHRENGTTAWTDSQPFSTSYSDNLTSATLTWTTDQSRCYAASYSGGTAPTSKAGRVVIDMPLKTANSINQVELLIYIDGTDGDCNNLGLTASAAIKLFFNTVPQA